MEAYQCGNDIRLSPSAVEILDEGEGLENLGHDGVMEPEVVSADIGNRLKMCSILRFAALWGSVLRLRFWCWDWWPAHIKFGAGIGGQLTFWCWDLWGSREPIVQPGFGCTERFLRLPVGQLLRVALLPAAAAGFAPQLDFIMPDAAAGFAPHLDFVVLTAPHH